MSYTLDNYHRLSIQDLKRCNALKNGHCTNLKWNTTGRTSFGLTTIAILSHKLILLYYTIEGKEYITSVWLQFVPSNLHKQAGGYWNFICPVKKEPCRVLYLHGGQFKCRKALPHGTLYKCQTYMGKVKAFARAFDYSELVEKMDAHFRKPYAKLIYKGRSTRRLKRLERLENKLEGVYKACLNI